MDILKTISESRFILRRRPAGSAVFLTIAALGVVYGDIGTSPLYAVNQIFFGYGGLTPTREHVLGAIGLIFWILTIIMSLKYITFVLRADNDGEGGVFALLQFIQDIPWIGIGAVSALLIFAAGLLFGQGIITPAISVLAAVEGLGVARPALQPYIIPLAIAILALLFGFQYKGASKMGSVFGPVVIVWFLAIGALGLSHIAAQPGILSALNPLHGIRLLQEVGPYSVLLIIAGAMLVVTGGEALYADLGHFGRLPIRIGWFSLVYPALILNYLGQGAFLLGGSPVAHGNIFYSMVPPSHLIPMIILATLAAVIASQAFISGAFSLARQAMSLDLLPRLKVIYTHAKHEGQVYLPLVNWILCASTIGVILFFKTSTALAGAYGLAVSGLMLATSIAMIGVAVVHWRWSMTAGIGLFGGFALMEGLFLVANSLRFFQGGFMPVTIGVVLFIVMTAWRWGRRLTSDTYRRYPRMSVSELTRIKSAHKTDTFEKSAIMMSANPVTSLDDPVPPIIQFFWERYHALPRDLIFLTVTIAKQPYIHKNRYRVTVFQNRESGSIGSMASVTVRFGFMEIPDVESILSHLAHQREIHLSADPNQWLIHIMRGRLIPMPGMSIARKISFSIFRTLRNLAGPSYYFYGLGRDLPLSLEMVPIKIK
ncbi:MAG: KUP/HAK/KT family potassium transporter [Patescibacteria group bacterium]